MDRTGINKISYDAKRKTCGVGYVVLSRAQNKDVYISSSFRNNRITIITEDYEVIPNCIVSKNVWQYLEFPDDIKSRGSEVVWINVPYQNRIIILDVIHKRDELSYIQTPNQFKFQREVGDNVVTVQGDGVTGVLTLTAQGTDTGEGEIYIKVLNSSELAVFDLYVQGTVSVDIEKDLNFRVGNKVEFTVRDESNPQNQGLFRYTLGTGWEAIDEFNNKTTTNNSGIYNEVDSTNKIYARATGSTSEPGLLGDKTYQLLNEIEKLLNSMVTVLQGAAAGQYVLAPPVLGATATWQQNIATIIRELSQIKAKNFELS